MPTESIDFIPHDSNNCNLEQATAEEKPVNVGRLKVGLKYEAIGGMAPWREIWNTVDGPGEKPLLGVQPWQKRELRRSPLWKGDQEWIRYRGV